LKDKAEKSRNYEAALDYAWELFRKTDLQLQAERCRARPVGAVWEDGAEGSVDDLWGEHYGIEVRFMNRRYLLSPDKADLIAENGREVPVHYQILILHCFLYHNGKEPTGKLISFLDIKDGLLYANIYKARTSLPLKFALKGNPGLLIDAAQELGGRRSELGGDVSAIFEPFHNIPISVIFWRGDEEFSPEVNFLFDEGIREMLPAEDVVVLAECLGREIR
jgi:hypothetical protein